MTLRLYLFDNQKTSSKLYAVLSKEVNVPGKALLKKTERPEAGTRWGRERKQLRKESDMLNKKNKKKEWWKQLLCHPHAGISVHTDMKTHNYIFYSTLIFSFKTWAFH